LTLLKKEGPRRGAHVFWLSRILLGGTESKKGRGATMHVLDRVSEGQLNERLMNAAGLDEPITRTRSVCFLSKNHSVTLPSP